VVVRDQGSLDWCADAPVVPDRCGEGEQAGGDAGVDPSQGAPAVVFEVELPLEGVDDGLDPLALPGEFAKARGLIPAVGPDQMGLEIVADERSEAVPGESLVPRMTCLARTRWWSRARRAAVTSRSPSPGWASPQITGMPSAVVIR
jgi:hypothetical protein